MLWSKRLSVIPSESPALQWALEGSHVDDVRDRMVAEEQSPASGTRTWRRGHQISTDPAQKKKSPASTNGKRMRQRDAGRAVLIFLKDRYNHSLQKTALGLGSSQICRDTSSSVETPLQMSPPPPH